MQRGVRARIFPPRPFPTGDRAMPSTFATLAAAAWVATFLGGPCLASAQSLAVTPGGRAPRTGTARVVSTAPTVEGRLNERVWAEAESLADFLQREPSESAPVSERTVGRIHTDREALYVGAWLPDRHPTALVPGAKVREGTVADRDYLA